MHTCEIVARPLTWRQARVALLWARAGTRHALLHAWTLAYAADDDDDGGAFPFTRTPRMCPDLWTGLWIRAVIPTKPEIFWVVFLGVQKWGFVAYQIPK